MSGIIAWCLFPSICHVFILHLRTLVERVLILWYRGEGGREGEREGEREGGREGERKGGREEGREEGRKGGRKKGGRMEGEVGRN